MKVIRNILIAIILIAIIIWAAFGPGLRIYLSRNGSSITAEIERRSGAAVHAVVHTVEFEGVNLALGHPLCAADLPVIPVTASIMQYFARPFIEGPMGHQPLICDLSRRSGQR